MTSWWHRMVFVVSVILASGVAATVVVAVVQSPSEGERFLKALDIVISWPLAVLVLGLAFGVTFRNELSQFIRNIGLIRFPGGTEIHSSQQAPETTEASTSRTPTSTGREKVTLTAEQQTLLRTYMENLTKQASDAQEEKKQILDTVIKVVSEKQKEVVYWWFQYLSLFFVPATKLVLQWFSSQTVPPTKDFYEEFWKGAIPDPKERETILMVLLHHQLLQPKPAVIEITQAGRDFLSFLTSGRLPWAQS